MPIFRGKDGKVKRNDNEDVSTRKIERTENEPSSYDESSKRDEDSVSVIETEEPKTRILYRRSSTNTTKPVADAMSDPVVGWLVIVNGPGKGNALQLGYGMNSIGRGKTERVCLDFGDEDISRTQHALVTYDPRGRKFYVQHGGGQNLTYLGEQPLLVPDELLGNEEISLGQTTLRFVPLCGEDFDWQNNS